MARRLELKTNIGPDRRAAREDFGRLRWAFSRLGLFNPTREAHRSESLMSPGLARAIRVFQAGQGLHEDASLRPEGPTEVRVNSLLDHGKDLQGTDTGRRDRQHARENTPGALAGRVGSGFENHPDDAAAVGAALSRLGNIPPGASRPFNTGAVFDGLKSFQSANGLKRDGIITPDGPTEQFLTRRVLDNSAIGEPGFASRTERRSTHGMIELPHPNSGRRQTTGVEDLPFMTLPQNPGAPLPELTPLRGHGPNLAPTGGGAQTGGGLIDLAKATLADPSERTRRSTQARFTTETDLRNEPGSKAGTGVQLASLTDGVRQVKERPDGSLDARDLSDDDDLFETFDENEIFEPLPAPDPNDPEEILATGVGEKLKEILHRFFRPSETRAQRREPPDPTSEQKLKAGETLVSLAKQRLEDSSKPNIRIEFSELGDNINAQAAIEEFVKAFRDGSLIRPKADELIQLGLEHVSDENAELVRDETGVDISGYQRTIDTQGLAHAFNRHGPGIEDRPGQVPINEASVSLYLDVVNNPDSITLRPNTKTRAATIKYTKQINGHAVFVEEVRTRKKMLTFKTMFIKSTR